MLSFGLPRALRSTAGTAAALMLAAAVTSDAIATEPDAEQQLLEQIQETLSREGPNAASSLEAVTALALLYQESGDYDYALAALERAVQLVRINRGLHSLEQVPLVRQSIRIEEVRGNHAGAWEREQALLALVRRHPDDLRTVPVLKEIADKQMEVLGAVLAGERPPQVVLGCFYKQWPGAHDGDCHSGTRKTIEQGMLAEAHRNYSDAIGIMLRNGLYASDELRALELSILQSVDSLRARYGGPSDHPFALVPGFVSASSIEPWRSRIAPVAALAAWDLPYPDDGIRVDDESHMVAKHVQMMDPYQRGRQSLRRLAAYAAASGASPLRQADAVAQVADWDLLYSRNGEAIETYEAAYAMLANAAMRHETIDEFFAPSTPVVLPAFRSNPLAMNEARSATGHVDVAFEITKYGRSRGVELLGAENASPDAMDRLVMLIKSNRFRPRLTEGRLVDVTPVVLRYYLYD